MRYKEFQFTNLFLLALFTAGSVESLAQEINYDESMVPDYSLPDPLMMEDGTAVTEVSQWLVRDGS